jgi:hypothetical protein
VRPLLGWQGDGNDRGELHGDSEGGLKWSCCMSVLCVLGEDSRWKRMSDGERRAAGRRVIYPVSTAPMSYVAISGHVTTLIDRRYGRVLCHVGVARLRRTHHCGWLQ